MLLKKGFALSVMLLLVVSLICVTTLPGSSTGDEDDNGVYSLKISSTDGGSVFRPGEGTFYFEKGDEVELQALPWAVFEDSTVSDEKVYSFHRWTGDNDTIDDDISGKTTIEMKGNYTIKAEFRPDFDVSRYNLTIDIEGQGTTDPTRGNHMFYYTEEDGGEITILADPADGWAFDRWSGDYEGTNEEITIRLDEDKELTAHFEERQQWRLIIGIAVLVAVIIGIIVDAKRKKG